MMGDKVRTGLEVLLRNNIGELIGKQVGVLANNASVTSDLIHIADALAAAGVSVRALFGPEHGIRGDAAPGAHVGDAIDPRLGVRVYSLYGESHSPSHESLADIEVMVVDLQDVGARFYTYISTIANAMTACGECGVSVWLLDRPNPITGLNAEGPVLNPDFASFVGMFPIPIRHGLTIGELALLFAHEFDIDCDLRVIPMQEWTRNMWFDETGLPWVMPSPNMPTVDTATVYPGMCLLEGTNVATGRGTARPFEIIGSPWIDAYALRSALIAYDLPGATFRECHFVPHASKYKDETCHGVQIHVTERNAYMPVFAAVMLISTLRALHPDCLEFLPPNSDGRRHFDLLAGSTKLREQIASGLSPWEIAQAWKPGVASFNAIAEAYRLY